jgi:hypothetical protein
MPQAASTSPSALWDALKAAGTTPSSKRKAALIDALRVETALPKTSTPIGLAEAVKPTS